jgi:acetoin utilization deacetylase AcuC-like enzyme
MHATNVITDQRYLEHRPGEYHPESPQRLERIYRMLKDADISGRFTEVRPRAATREELALNHSVEYVERIEKTAGKAHTMLDPDTHTSAGSWEAAIHAAGGVLVSLDMIMEGRFNNGFALVRPPGHHAEASRAMGFCLFNNIAIGAHYLIQKYHLERLLIVDWDLHHGNGTQKSFYRSPQVLYLSTHQYPYYPGSGSMEEIGEGKGAGYTVNIPLQGGQGDADYLKIFQEIILPIAAEYQPQFVLISAGYDPYYLDPLGAMRVTPDGFAAMTRQLMDCAQKCCEGKVLVVLEGGYHLDGITESAKKTLLALIQEPGISPNGNAAGAAECSPQTYQVIRTVKKIHSKTWGSLG